MAPENGERTRVADYRAAAKLHRERAAYYAALAYQLDQAAAASKDQGESALAEIESRAADSIREAAVKLAAIGRRYASAAAHLEATGS